MFENNDDEEVNSILSTTTSTAATSPSQQYPSSIYLNTMEQDTMVMDMGLSAGPTKTPKASTHIPKVKKILMRRTRQEEEEKEKFKKEKQDKLTEEREKSSRSLEQREAAYKAARERILGQEAEQAAAMNNSFDTDEEPTVSRKEITTVINNIKEHIHANKNSPTNSISPKEMDKLRNLQILEVNSRNQQKVQKTSSLPPDTNPISPSSNQPRLAQPRTTMNNTPPHKTTQKYTPRQRFQHPRQLNNNNSAQNYDRNSILNGSGLLPTPVGYQPMGSTSNSSPPRNSGDSAESFGHSQNLPFAARQNNPRNMNVNNVNNNKFNNQHNQGPHRGHYNQRYHSPRYRQNSPNSSSNYNPRNRATSPQSYHQNAQNQNVLHQTASATIQQQQISNPSIYGGFEQPQHIPQQPLYSTNSTNMVNQPFPPPQSFPHLPGTPNFNQPPPPIPGPPTNMIPNHLRFSSPAPNELPAWNSPTPIRENPNWSSSHSSSQQQSYQHNPMSQNSHTHHHQQQPQHQQHNLTNQEHHSPNRGNNRFEDPRQLMHNGTFSSSLFDV